MSRTGGPGKGPSAGKNAGAGKGGAARKPGGTKSKGSARSSGGGLHEKVRTARKRTVSSNRWLERQINDPYVRRAQAEGYRSRAAYKLIELDEKFGLLARARAIVDLGIAPGGWSQVARKVNPRAAVVGIDLLECLPLPGVAILQMDFMDDAAPDALLEALGSAPDLVLSDMAANTVGHPQTDHLRTMGLAEAAADFAVKTLKPGGAFVAKVFAGGTDRELLMLLKTNFTSVKHAKPPASRKASPELYVIATGFRGAAEPGR
jgi:23S rRNA (uridine2552-2'-O)-methyltransferase